VDIGRLVDSNDGFPPSAFRPGLAMSAKSATKKRRTVVPEDLLKFHLVADPQISPDGTTVLFSRKHVGEKNNYVSNLWTVSASGGDPKQFTSGGKDGHGRWSPDGKTVAFISGREEAKPQVYLIPADGGEAQKLTTFPEGSLAAFKWSPDGTLLAVKFREAEPEWTQEAKKQRKETGGSTPARVIDEMYYRFDGDGYFNAQRHALYIVDVATGEHRLLYDKDRLGWFSFDWSPDSKEIAVAGNTSREPFLKFWKWTIVRVKVKSGKVTKLEKLPDGEKMAVAWSPDGKQIAFAGRHERDMWGVRNSHLFVCDADHGGNLRNLTDHTDYCLSAITLSDMSEAAFDEQIAWGPDGSRVFVRIGWHGETHLASIGVRTQGFDKSLGSGDGELTFHTKGRVTAPFGNLSADGTAVAMTVADTLHLSEVAVLRQKGTGPFFGQESDNAKKHAPPKNGPVPVFQRPKRLTRFNEPLLDELELSEPEPTWIESASGTKIHVWVMKPPGFKAGKKYPAILTIHGGPHCQYGEAFFHEFQTFAAAGYVVVFSNPRGSKGYGEEHCVAIKGNWGAADWEDVQAVTKYMRELPFVDANRMGVCGGSYGGYMTNWVIGHTDEFAAAVTDRCVSNLVSMSGSSDIPLVPNEYWEGNSWDNTEVIWSQSPMKFFGNVKTPTLVVHSEGDLRCNVEQSEQVFAALKLRGIPTRFVRYPASTSHGLSRKGPPDLRLHRLGKYLEWSKRWLG
jgi:dipeptidyl aminopeptidase/acylaminoacyl peptidase